MRTAQLRRSLLGAVLAGGVLASSVMAAPPLCGRQACREEIQACVDTECEGLRGSAHAQCMRACVDAVQGACDADPSVCNPEMTTTTTEVTTTSESPSSSTSTTLMGSPSGVFVE